jgi:hypothetical protein
MKKIHADLFAVISRFPDREKTLKQLFLKNTDFQGICKDYRKCQDALIFLARSDKENTSAACKEYALLLNELEAEIMEKLDEWA